jgi:predicted dienelactone hydrolase
MERLLAALLLCGACSAPGDSGAPSEPPPAWVEPDRWGPYGVGVETIEIVDPRGKELEVEVWYPAVVAEGAEPDPYEEIQLALDAHREADPDLRGAPYPLLAFSHGFMAIRYQSAYLTEWLASHGYVVVAPDHPDNTMFDIDQDATWRVMLERPDDLRYSVDGLIALAAGDHPLFAGMVEEGDYGVLGHSFGAVTTLVVGGGAPDWQGVIDFCAERDVFVCDYMAEGLGPEDAEGHGTVDERATVTVPMSPGVWYAFGPEGANLAGVRQPLVLGGDRDQILSFEDEIRPVYEALASPKRFAVFADAGHYAFSNICDLAPFFADDCAEDEGWIDIALAQEISRVIVTAHLDLHLRGKAEAAAFLDPGYLARWEELIWEEGLSG